MEINLQMANRPLLSEQSSMPQEILLSSPILFSKITKEIKTSNKIKLPELPKLYEENEKMRLLIENNKYLSEINSIEKIACSSRISNRIAIIKKSPANEYFLHYFSIDNEIKYKPLTLEFHKGIPLFIQFNLFGEKILYIIGTNVISAVIIHDGIMEYISHFKIDINIISYSIFLKENIGHQDFNQYIIVALEDKNIKIFRIKENGEIDTDNIITPSEKIKIISMSFNRNGTKLALSNGSDTIKINDFPEMKTILTLKTKTEINLVKFSNKLDCLIIGDYSSNIYYYDFKTNKTEMIREIDTSNKKLPTYELKNIFFSPDQSLLIILYNKFEKKVPNYKQFLSFYSFSRRIEEANYEIQLENDKKKTDISFYSNNYLVVSNQIHINFIELKDVANYLIKECSKQLINSISLIESNENIYMIISGIEKKIKGFCFQKKENIFKEIEIIVELKDFSFSNKIFSCVSPNGKYIVFSQKDQIYLCYLNHNQDLRENFTINLITTFPYKNSHHIIFSKENNYFSFISENVIYCIKTSVKKVYSYSNHTIKIKSIDFISYSEINKTYIVFSGCPNLFSSSRQNQLIIWDFINNDFIYLTGFKSKIIFIQISPLFENQKMYTSTSDGKIFVWNLKNITENYNKKNESNQNKNEKKFKYYYETEIYGYSQRIKSMCISQDSRKLFTSYSDNTFIIWCLETGQIEKKQILSNKCKIIKFSNDLTKIILVLEKNIQINFINNYEYNSTFHIFQKILKENLSIQQYKLKYPLIFQQHKLQEIFNHYETNENNTILHLFAYLKNETERNLLLSKSFEICEHYNIMPKLSQNKITNQNPLDIICSSKNMLVLNDFLRLILNKNNKPTLGLCNYINYDFLSQIALIEPSYLREIIEYRLCPPFGDIPNTNKAINNELLKRINTFVIDENYFNDLIVNKKSFMQRMFCLKNEENPENKNSLIKKVKIKILDIPNVITPRTKKDERNLLKAVSDLNSKHAIFGSNAFKAIIEYKWKLYAKKIYLLEAFLFLSYLIFLTIHSLIIVPERIYNQNEDNRKTLMIFSFIFDMILLIYWFYFVFGEIMEIKSRGMRYFLDLWNYFDIPMFCLLITFSIIDILNIFEIYEQIHVLKGILAILLFITWTRLITFARGFRGMAFMVRLLIEVFIDMKNFLILMFFLAITLSFSGFLLQKENEFRLFYSFNAFYRLILGDFSHFDNLGENTEIYWILWFFFFIATFVLMIIMLNLLIAIISNTFSNVTEDNDLVDTYEKTKLICEIDEKFTSKNIKEFKEKYDGYYICIIYSKEREFKSDKEKILLDRLENIEKILERIDSRLN